MIVQIYAILKMKITHLFLFILLCLNLFSVANINTQEDMNSDINDRIEEAISLKARMKSLYTVLGSTDEKYCDNFFEYCDWKIDYLKNMDTKIKEKSYSQSEYDKDILNVMGIDINCYANTKIGDLNKKSTLSIDFDYTKLYVIYSKSNTVQHIHQQYIDASKKYKILSQKVEKNMYLDERSVFGHFLVNLNSDSLIALIMPIVFMIFTCLVLEEYKKNNLLQFYDQVYRSRFKMYLNIIVSIFFTILIMYFVTFVLTSLMLVKNQQNTTLITKILVDKENLFNFSSYPSDTNTLYYMGNKYYSASNDFDAIPECLKLMPIWRVLVYTFILDFIKGIFYSFIGSVVFFFNKRNHIVLIFLVCVYFLSQFMLLEPMTNPFAITSSYSVVCGGYIVTWLSSLIILFLYSCLLLFLIIHKIRRVDI